MKKIFALLLALGMLLSVGAAYGETMPIEGKVVSTQSYPIISQAKGTIEQLVVPENELASRITVLGITKKPKEKSIEHADVLVVAGRGIKKKEDLELVYQLAEALGGDYACTRPLIEAGWMDPRRQIGLSGRTVRPKLIITCGVSGAIQFVAGMEHSDEIFAINSDPKAAIFKVANYAVVGDLYEIIPQLLARIQQGRKIA